MKETAVDALVFDMDGTLWDAVDSYCKVWDTTAVRVGTVRPPVRYAELVALMGKPLVEIYHCLMDAYDSEPDRFMATLTDVENELMPVLGGRLYPHVHETLAALKKRVRLFMISNCTGRGLDNFLTINNLKPYFTDWLSFGETGVDKDKNLKTLIDCYNLRRPVYVGDIQRDSDSSHAAGVEFCWASYGFGRVTDADYTIGAFDELETKVLDYGSQI